MLCSVFTEISCFPECAKVYYNPGSGRYIEYTKRVQRTKLSAMWQFIKFYIVGALNTVLNYLIYII